MNSQTPLKRKTTQSLVASILIFSMLAGLLSACNMIIETPSPTEELSYELTPTVQNPATQELTLVSPTEVATEMPTITLTREPTATATEMPTPTEVEKYSIDLEKLSTTPESYQYLVDHKDEFVQGPDPLEVGVEKFYKWYNEKLIPSLGDMADRDANVIVGAAGEGEYDFYISVVSIRGPVRGQMEFWYFEHHGIVYPVFGVVVPKRR